MILLRMVTYVVLGEAVNKKKISVPEVPSPCDPDNGTRNPAVTMFTVGGLFISLFNSRLLAITRKSIVLTL